MDGTGNVWAAGFSTHNPIKFGSQSTPKAASQDAVLIKIDSSGTVLNLFTSTGTGVTSFQALAATPSGDVIVGGMVAGNLTLGGLKAHVAGTDRDLFVAKLASNGTWAWIVRWGADGSDDTWFSHKIAM